MATQTSTTETVDKSSRRVQRMFGEIAPRYDLMNHLLSLNIDRYWRWQTVRQVPPNGAAPILDVCTGTGDLAIAYARRGHAPVIGADFCREMLVLGQKKREKLGVEDQITFVSADTMQLPFSDGFFQLVVVAFGLRNVSDTARGLAEMVRVCQPLGRVAVLEFSLPEWQPLKAIYGGYFRHVLPRVGQFLAKNKQDAYSYLPASVSEFPSGPALVKKMEEAGLVSVSYRPLTLGVATLYLGSKPQ